MSRKILIVDDDPEMVQLVRYILEGQDQIVLEAMTGAEALAVAAQEQPALILLDVELPGDLNGLDVCRQLRAHPRTANQIVVMLSGFSHTSDRAQGMLAGADDYITKPIDPVDLATRVREFLRRPREGQSATNILTEILHGVLAAIGAELCWLLTVDASGDILVPTGIAGSTGEETGRKFLRSVASDTGELAFALDTKTSPLVRVLDSGKPLLAQTVEQVDELPGGGLLVRGMQAISARSASFVPIALRGENLGVLACFFSAAEPRRGADPKLLSVSATQAAIAIDNSRLLLRVANREHEARKAQRFHETLVEAMGDGLAVLDGRTRIQFVNRRLCRMLGYDAAELVGRKFSDLIHADDRDATQQLLARSTGQTSSFEKALIRKDGSALPALAVHVPRPDDLDADDVGEILVVTDLTLQKARETALLRQTRQLAAINHAAQAMAASLDLDSVPQTILEETVQVLSARGGSILLIEDESKDLIFRAVVGPKSEELLGERVPMGRGIVGWIAKHATPTMVEDALNDPRFYERIDETTGLTTYSVIGAPLLIKRQVIGVLEVINKIEGRFDKDDLNFLESLAQAAASAIVNARLYRDLRNHAIELEKAYSSLKEADRLKDEMIQNVSHELRTPLTFILGYVELIANGELGAITEEQRRGLDVVRTKSLGLTKIVSDIVTLQRMTVGSLERRLLELPKVIGEAVRTVRVTAEHGGYAIEVDVPDDLPSVRADEDRVMQVLDNLLANAIKFSSEGSTISVRARENGNSIQIEVEDRGIGIRRENLGKIFNRFYQVDGSTTRRFGGVGLGLAICKEIVEAHGGEIWAESEEGVGSTFCFTLPKINRPTLA